MPSKDEMLQEVQDEKDRVKAEKAYNAASSTPPNPAPKPTPAPATKKYAKGGYLSKADGIAQRGKTRGRIV